VKKITPVQSAISGRNVTLTTRFSSLTLSISVNRMKLIANGYTSFGAMKKDHRSGLFKIMIFRQKI